MSTMNQKVTYVNADHTSIFSGHIHFQNKEMILLYKNTPDFYISEYSPKLTMTQVLNEKDTINIYFKSIE